jgi:DNA-binding GntR family transcriptional regulator
MKSNLRYKAYEYLKNKIVYFDYKPGQKIIESEIASNLKISRTPVREALLILESEKLVKCKGKAGFYVFKLSTENIDHYYKLRVLLENFIAPMILENITSQELKSLERNLSQAKKALDLKNLKDIIRYETEFHHILYNASRSSVVVEVIEPLSVKFHWLRSISLHAPDAANKSVMEHKKIYKAIIKKDLKEFKMLIQSHFKTAEKNYNVMQSLFV